MRTRANTRSLFARLAASGSSASLEHLESRVLLTTVFGPMPAVTAGSHMTSQVVADFDGDGINDLAGLEAVDAQNSILFFKGRGDGSFDAPLRTLLNVRATAIAAGELLPGGGVELVAIGGAGTPTSASQGEQAYRETLVRVLQFSTEQGKLRVTRIGTIAAPDGGDSRPSAPVIGDFTGDGAADIVFAPSSAAGRLVVMEVGDRGLRVATTIVLPTPAGRDGRTPIGPIAADLDGDGRTDIASFTQAGYVALLNSSSGLSHDAIGMNLSVDFDWKFADVDGDGKADAVSMWTPPGQEHSTAESRYAVVQMKKGMGGGVFGATQAIGTVLIGAASSGGKNAIDNEWLLVGQDIDHDGLGDIVYVRDYDASDATGRSVRERVVAITHARDGSWNVPNFALGPNEWSGEFAGRAELLGGGSERLVDLDGDGRADLLDIGRGLIRGYLSSELLVLDRKPEAQPIRRAEDALENAIDARVVRTILNPSRFSSGFGGWLDISDAARHLGTTDPVEMAREESGTPASRAASSTSAIGTSGLVSSIRLPAAGIGLDVSRIHDGLLFVIDQANRTGMRVPIAAMSVSRGPDTVDRSGGSAPAPRQLRRLRRADSATPQAEVIVTLVVDRASASSASFKISSLDLAEAADSRQSTRGTLNVIWCGAAPLPAAAAAIDISAPSKTLPRKRAARTNMRNASEKEWPCPTWRRFLRPELASKVPNATPARAAAKRIRARHSDRPKNPGVRSSRPITPRKDWRRERPRQSVGA